MVDGLKALGTPPRYTELPNAGHAIWGTVLSDPKLFTWLFEQRRGDPEYDDDSGFFGYLRRSFLPAD